MDIGNRGRKGGGMTMVHCEKCIFWVKKTKYGECRKTAPQARASANNGYAKWPHTWPDDWCGEGRVKWKPGPVKFSKGPEENDEFHGSMTQDER